MTPQEYYSHVIGRIKSCFEPFHYVIGKGRRLIDEGWDPHFPIAVEPVSQLEKFTVEKGLQVYLPVIGRKSRSVLMPLDIDVFLGGENNLLYIDKDSQRKWFSKVSGASRFLEDYFRRLGIPYLLDYTPSGAHFLWLNPLGSRAVKEVQRLGFLEEDLIAACRYTDLNDIKRRWGVSLEAARVFSGLGKLAEFLCFKTMGALGSAETANGLPVAVGDSLDQCIDFDISWAEGSPFMRSLRSPYSLHCKNQEQHGFSDAPPLVDVVGTYFDGKKAVEEPDLSRISDCMWDLEKAANHAARFPEGIPKSNDSLFDLIGEYRKSPLALFHDEFEKTEDLPRGEALNRAGREVRLSQESMNLFQSPNPAALQPKRMRRLVDDLVLEAGWKPRHAANVLRDLYINPAHHWPVDFFKFPPGEKSDFWARSFSALGLWKKGRLDL